MKAVTYKRFSSDDQRDGDSIARQNESIDRHVARKSLRVELEIIDEGKSASKGDHLSKGGLGKFLAEAEKQNHPWAGVAFVFDELSRFSRLGDTRTKMLMVRLLVAGMEIHIAENDGTVIRSIDDMDKIDFALMSTVKNVGNQELSKKLVVNVGAAKKRNRQAIRDSRSCVHVVDACVAEN